MIRRGGLADGQLDRELLGQAITFALDSMRSGLSAELDSRGGGDVGGLWWDQSSWLTPKFADTEEVDVCGTSCCVAGWIRIVRSGQLGKLRPIELYAELATGSIAYQATEALVGSYALWSLAQPSPTSVDLALDRLFNGGNDIVQLVDHANELLRLYDQEPLRLTPEGSFV